MSPKPLREGVPLYMTGAHVSAPSCWLCTINVKLSQKCETTSFLFLAPRGVAKSFRECEKSISHKILHSYDDPKNFPTFIFSLKKKHFEKKNENFKNAFLAILKNDIFRKIFQREIRFSFENFLMKTSFFRKFPKKYFFKIFFFNKKIKVEKKLDH